MNIFGDFERTRDETDASLAVERGMTDALLERGAASPGAGDPETGAARAVKGERAETDESLLAERNEVDDSVGEASQRLLQWKRAVGVSKADAARRDEFLAMVSHDLRNPLGIIALDAEMIERLCPDDVGGRVLRQASREILTACAGMRRMVGDLLDVAAMETGALSIHAVRTDLLPVVEEAVASFASRPESPGPAVLVDLPVGPVFARIDAHRVGQVLANLIGNAIKFTGRRGTVTVRVRPAGPGVTVSVRDTGIGIPEADLPHVFERFWQLGRNDRRGLGLGLYICKSIVDAHRGTIGVVSDLGRGTEVHFTLPSG